MTAQTETTTREQIRALPSIPGRVTHIIPGITQRRGRWTPRPSGAAR
jgi:hypothetical protein